MSTSSPEPPSGPSTEPSRSTTSVLERELVEQPQLSEPGDHERFAHYVRKEKIMTSAMSGEPVTALCGKVWVPGRDPKKFPVCPACKEIYEGLREPADGGPGSGGGQGGGSGSGSGGGQQ
ncbi:DUF3039 domain-containing protein [uncultured Pseudokineococcus sp.]|uniref:DUF3039 domain-containing protein n=1 Tax=uncultured Pseudokineococcus sp. TaxID=1642928 RepID=UPI0026235C18|nr:DUF3039 domain-containing protein [uncultured Pseudokineococcus sp.]